MALTSFQVQLDDIIDNDDEDDISLVTRLKYQTWYLDTRCAWHGMV